MERIFFMKNKTKILVTSALLVALQIVFTRIIALEAGVIRISFGFFPVAVAGMLLGPLGGGAVGVIADIIGMLMISKGGVYFFPFTITEFLYGIGFGLMLYKKDLSHIKITIFTVIQFILLNLILNSVWNYLYYLMIIGTPKGLWVIITSRLFASLVNLPVQILGINLICKYLKNPLKKLGWRN